MALTKISSKIDPVYGRTKGCFFSHHGLIMRKPQMEIAKLPLKWGRRTNASFISAAEYKLTRRQNPDGSIDHMLSQAFVVTTATSVKISDVVQGARGIIFIINYHSLSWPWLFFDWVAKSSSGGHQTFIYAQKNLEMGSAGVSSTEWAHNNCQYNHML